MADNVSQESPVESKSGQSGPPFKGHRKHPWHNRFSEDELRVFAECKHDSFWYRALPLATIFGAVTYAAVAKGYLRPNARFGAIPKLTLAVILGYGIGKVSYRKTCMKKMMELPNSNVGQYLKSRQGKCGPWGGFPSREGMMMVGAGADPRDMYWGAGPLPADQPSTPEKQDV